MIRLRKRHDVFRERLEATQQTLNGIAPDVVQPNTLDSALNADNSHLRQQPMHDLTPQNVSDLVQQGEQMARDSIQPNMFESAEMPAIVEEQSLIQAIDPNLLPPIAEFDDDLNLNVNMEVNVDAHVALPPDAVDNNAIVNDFGENPAEMEDLQRQIAAELGVPVPHRTPEIDRLSDILNRPDQPPVIEFDFQLISLHGPHIFSGTDISCGFCRLIDKLCFSFF